MNNLIQWYYNISTRTWCNTKLNTDFQQLKLKGSISDVEHICQQTGEHICFIDDEALVGNIAPKSSECVAVIGL